MDYENTVVASIDAQQVEIGSATRGADKVAHQLEDFGLSNGFNGKETCNETRGESGKRLGTMGRVEGIGAKKKREKATAKTLFALIERQAYKCALTGIELEPETAEIDHIIPVAKGGENTVDNCQIVHVRVNRMKGAMDQSEFLEWCSKIVRYTAENGFRS